MAIRNQYLTAVLSIVLAAWFLYMPNGVLAQSNNTTSSTSSSSTYENKKIEADIKGMVGLGLVGAELGFVIPAAVGLDDTWAMIVFPILGAGGGVAAGYFLLEKPDHTEVAVASLAAGMALVIPALVLTLSITSYAPEDEETTVTTAKVERKTKYSANRRIQQMARASGTGLVRWSGQGLFLGAPAISLARDMTQKEALQQGSKPRNELRVALLSGKF